MKPIECYLKDILLLLLVTFLSISQMPQPRITSFWLSHATKEIKKGQIINIYYLNSNYVAQVWIKQRKNNPWITYAQAFHNHSRQFVPSTSCRKIDPQVNVVSSQKLQLKKQIEQFYYDPKDNLIYLRTNNSLILTSPKQNIIEMFIQKIFPTEYKNIGNTKFIKFKDYLFLTNGYQLYQTQADLQIRLYDNLLEYTGEENEYIIINGEDRYILLVGKYQYFIFEFNLTTKKFNKLANKHTKEQLKINQGFIIDALQDNNSLYLLNNVFGIIQIRDFHPYYRQKYQIISYPIDFGQKKSFIKLDNTFQIICKYNKKRFLVEMYHNFSTQTLTVNRFYDRVSGTRDMQFIQDQLFILGQQQIHIYGPAVNIHTLLKVNQFPYIFQHDNMRFIIPLQPSYSVYGNKLYTKLLGIDTFGLNVIQIFKKQISFQCKFDSSTHAIVSTIGSCCHGIGCRKTSTQELCQYNQGFIFQITNDIEYIEGILITGVVVVLAIVIGCGVWGCCNQKSQSIKNQIIELKQKIKQKIEKSQNQKIPAQQVNSDIVFKQQQGQN